MDISENKNEEGIFVFCYRLKLLKISLSGLVYPSIFSSETSRDKTGRTRYTSELERVVDRLKIFLAPLTNSLAKLSIASHRRAAKS